MRMFRQMEESNFEVHMSTTTGYHEKCIDISLAVEMMHYASVPGAYDVAVIVSGDKDFIPALARIRQKGKRVALCSMRNCCSRDLLDPRRNSLADTGHHAASYCDMHARSIEPILAELAPRAVT